MSLRSEPVAGPGPYRHDRSLILQDFKELLQALAQAGCLEDFGHAHSRAVLLFDHVSHATYVTPTEETTAEILQSNLIDLLMAATSNGLRQLDQHWESPAAAGPRFLASLQAVSMLCHTLFRCNTIWMFVASHRDAMKSKLRRMAVDTGLLPTPGPICDRLLPILQSLQHSADRSTPQLSANQLDVIVLAQSLLDMWIGLFHAWPSPALESKDIAATVEPVAKIAVALLRIQAAADGKGSHVSSSSSSGATGHSRSSSGDSSSSYWNKYCMLCRGDLGTSRSLKVALTLALPMAALHKEDDKDDSDDDADDFLMGDSSSRAPAWCWSVHVQQLLLAYLAAVAAAQHSKLDHTAAPPAPGTTAARQQQQISMQHLKLLAALHVPAAAFTQRLEAAAKDDHLEMQSVLNNSEPLVVTSAVVFLLEHLDYRTRQGDAAAKSRLERWSAPVFLTCQELLLLGDKSLPSVGRAFHQFWSAVMATYKHADQAGLVEVLRQLLHPLYQVAIEGFKQYTDGRTIAALKQMYARDIESEHDPEIVAQQLIDQWLMITCLLIRDVNEQDLAAIILQEPPGTLAAVEAALRGAPAAAMCFPVVSAFSVASYILMALPTVIIRLQQRTMDHTAECKFQKQLLSLLCSSYKVVADTTGIRKKAVEPASMAKTLLHASIASCVLLGWMQSALPAVRQTATGPGNSCSRVGASSRTSSSASAAQQRIADSKQTAVLQGYAVRGRGMFVAGKLIGQQNTDIDTVMSVSRGWIAGFDGAFRQQLSFQLPRNPVAAAAAKQEVQQKLDNFMALLLAYEQPNNSGSSGRTPTTPQVAQLLQDFGALICAAIPLELCCNNPSCGHLAKLCELELVAGKSSRCSACKVARYCRRDCQKEHWKQHKAACKRLQG